MSGHSQVRCVCPACRRRPEASSFHQRLRDLRMSCLLGVLLAAWSSGCSRSGDGPSDSLSGFQDECHFIVRSIVEDLVAMSRFAQGQARVQEASGRASVVEKEDSPVGRPVYVIRFVSEPGKRRVDLELAVNRPIWEPSLYDPLVEKLFTVGPGRKGPTPVAAHAGSSLLARLSKLNVESIESANQVVSRELTGNFLNPSRHEQAALVLGALGLRESSGDFYDVRGLLCRITTHLAVARHFSGHRSYTPEGQVAEVILYALMGNQKEALDKLAKVPSGAETETWRRALRARITGDYRELQKAQDLTPLERVCFFEAYCRSVDTTAAWDTLPTQAAQGQADFCRIANSQLLSVQLGHVLNELSLPLEITELQQVLTLARGRTNEAEPDVALLNAAPEPCVTVTAAGGAQVQVIGWGHWGMFLQRHVCHAVQQNFRFLMRLWGVPDAAAEFSEQADAAFGTLQLYPFVRLANATTNETYHAAADACAQLLRRLPHLLGPRLWNRLHQHPPGLSLYLPPDLWDVSFWHKHNPPPFTAYQIRPRCNHRSLLHQPDAKRQLEALHARAPYDPDVTRAMLHAQHGDSGANAPVEVLEQAYAPVLDFSVPQTVRLARLVTNNPAAYERFMARAAAQKGLYYFDLGDYFARRDEPKKAAEYYEKGVSTCQDAVGVSNNSRWLVRYYFDQGRVAEAEQLADRAAEVYSHLGLKTKGDLLYWQGKYEESLECYRKIEERYDQPGVIIDWWVTYRGATNDTRYDSEVELRMKTLFPRGAEEVTLASFRNPPDEGVMIDGENDLLRAAGLKKGDIVVALNGRRAYDMPQYIYLRTKLEEPTMRLIHWNGRAYAEVTASPPNHRFGVQFKTYSRLR